MTARQAHEVQDEVAVTVVTPEDAPLAVFGSAVSEAVARLLEDNRVEMITSACGELPQPGLLSISPGSREVRVHRVVALPQLVGPAVPGVPSAPTNDFIPVDDHRKVARTERVYAAGDAADFPVTNGGIAAEQADAAAEAIAALAGGPVEPEPFHPVIRGILLDGEKPLYLSANITGGRGSASEVTEQPSWSPPTKIATRSLAPYLEERDRLADTAA